MKAYINGIIYCATNQINQKVYIGQTIKSLGYRKYEHWRDAKRINKWYFGKALRKYGLDSFDWEIVCTINAPTRSLLKEYLDTMERMFILQYNSVNRNNGYNCTEGGDGTSGFHHSLEARKKISAALKNRPPPTRETRRKMSKSLKGRHISEETRKNMSKGHKGIKMSVEHCKNISKSRKGMVFSEDHKRNISESKKGSKGPWLGKRRSEETKKKIGDALKRKPLSDEHKRKLSESLKKTWKRRRANESLYCNR